MRNWFKAVGAVVAVVAGIAALVLAVASWPPFMFVIWAGVVWIWVKTVKEIFDMKDGLDAKSRK